MSEEAAHSSVLAEAAAHYRAGRLAEALAACRLAQERGAAVGALFGYVLLAADRHGEAETAFRHALAHDPGDAEVAAGLGHALLAQNRGAEADPYFGAAWARQGTPGAAAMVDALTALAAGRWQEAERAYATALRHEPRQERAMRAVFVRAYRALAERVCAAGETAAACDLLLRLIDLTDEDDAVRDRVAELLLAHAEAVSAEDLPRDEALALRARLAAAYNRAGAVARAEAILAELLHEALDLIAREPAAACWRGLLDAFNSFPDHGRARALLTAGLRRRRGEPGGG